MTNKSPSGENKTTKESSSSSSLAANSDKKSGHTLIGISVSLFFVLGIGISNKMGTMHVPLVGAIAGVLILLLLILGVWLFIQRRTSDRAEQMRGYDALS